MDKELKYINNIFPNLLEPEGPAFSPNCGDYKRGKFLGKGGFAKCYEFTNQETKRVSAAKIIDKTTLTR